MSDTNPPRGRFIVQEGIDGCGKTTQIEALRQWLPISGLLPPGGRVIVSREPGGTALGKALRELLLHPLGEAATVPCAELLLYAADRAQHVETILRPALDAGDWVLCDRFTGSTAAYQGYGRGLPLAESCRRRGGRPDDRIEGEGEVFQAQVAFGFATLAAQQGWTCIDAGKPVAAVTEACCRAMVRSFGGGHE